MRRKALITVWVIPLLLLLFWVCGVVTGYSLGKAKADGCTSWNGRWFSSSQCTGDGYYGGSGNCTYISVFGFSSYQCQPVAPPPPPPGVNP